MFSIPSRLYAIALDACHGTNARLTARLLRDDRQLFDNGKSYAAVETFIRNMERKIHETEGATSKLSKNIGKVANTFCGFAVRMSELVAPLVPQSPEYAVPYGILIIIFKVSFGHVLMHICPNILEGCCHEKRKAEGGSRLLRPISAMSARHTLVRRSLSN